MIYEYGAGYFFNPEKLKEMPIIKRRYEEYKHRFIKSGGLESDERLLTFNEWKEKQEED